MKSRLYFMGSAALFWVGFFFVFRLIFLFYQWDLSTEYGFLELATAFLSGLRHDLSLMGYVLMLSGLILSIFFFLPEKRLRSTFTIIYTSITILFLLLLVPNLELYRNWNFHIDSTVLDYLKTPKEAIASTVTSVYILLSIISLASVILSYVLIRKFVISKLDRVQPIKYMWIPVLLLVTASMIIPIRGGFGIAPMNVGFVYFSKHAFVNHLAVNPIWNFSYSLKKAKKNKVVFRFMDEENRSKIINELYAEGGETNQVLKSKKPNIVLIILESFTSKATGLIEGGKSVTPNLDKYAKEGVYFSNFYGIGDRSKIGIVGLLSGYPSLPRRSVIAYSRKVEHLPSLCGRLNKLGYQSSFYYGGDIRFANMNSYINSMGYGKTVTVDNFPEELNQSKWGVHDQYVFDYLYNDIENTKAPYFKTFFTLSSHEPFDVPMETKVKGDSEDEKFMNSVYYTDKCLGDFVEKLRKRDDWDNTLVIMVADHGVRYIDKSKPEDFIKYKIPMIWLGGALAKTNIEVDKIGCQPDMSKMLLNQMGLSTDEFLFGKDLLNEKQKGFAFFDYNNGFGYIDRNGKSVFDLTAKKYIKKEGLIEKGENWKAILQTLNKDFFIYN